jgi:hypothetical protein
MQQLQSSTSLHAAQMTAQHLQARTHWKQQQQTRVPNQQDSWILHI